MAESDSDCELYTKTAERFKIESKAGEIEEVVDMAADEEEVRKIMEAVGSGISPMEALVNVQTETYLKGKLNKPISLTSSQSSGSESYDNSSPSIDIELYDEPRKLCNVPKNKSVTTSTLQRTRKSTRASTVASTISSLAKAKKRMSSEANLDSASKEVDLSTTVINVDDVVQDDGNVVVIEDHEMAEGLGSMAHGSRRKRGRPSSANRYATTSSNSRDLGTIVFDDDSEYCNVITTPIDFNKRYYFNSSTPNLNDKSSSDEDENFDNIPVKVTIEWTNDKRLDRKTFTLKKYQKFEFVYEDLAKLEGISVKRVVLMRNFTTIRPWDSPATLDMKFYGALTGFISSKELSYDDRLSYVPLDLSPGESVKKPENAISVKVQLESKQTLAFNLAKNGKMDTLYLMACEELNCDKNELKLFFDGEYVPPGEKLSTLDVEDGDIFHAHIKK